MSTLAKRSVTINGRNTSLALEPEFWAALEGAAAGLNLSVGAVVAHIDRIRGNAALSSACRVRVLHWALTEPETAE